MPIQYELVEADDNFWAIRLLEGKYKNVTYRYGTLKFMGEDDIGNGIMSFEYDILSHPSHLTREEIKGEDVDTIMGDILTQIIVESLEKTEGGNGNDREDNTEAPDTQ